MDLHEDENQKIEKMKKKIHKQILKLKKGEKKGFKCTFLLVHWFFTNESINDGNNKQSEMMAKWSPNLDALPKHVNHLVHMPNVKLQNSSQESITCGCSHV